jgi:methionine-rich copper-binding protein CopC
MAPRFWLALALVLVLAGSVLAHARLVRSEPRDGAVVRLPLRVVRAWFTQELDLRRSFMVVQDARGRVVARGGVDLQDLDRKTMVVRLGRIAPGTYTVRWRAVSSEDGDTTTGRFRFTVR